jgi:high-affinity K+ transport system ATPase subunit B
MYIKDYNTFNSGFNVEWIYNIAKKSADDIVNSMSDREKREALIFLSKKGLTPELAKRLSLKLELDKMEPSDKLSQELVGVINQEELLKEGFKEKLNRLFGLPSLTTFFSWITLSFGNESNDFINRIRDYIPNNIQGPILFIFMIITFVLIVVTIVKAVFPNAFKDGI